MTPTAPETTPIALRGPRGQVLALSLAFLLTAPGALVRITGAGLGDVVAPIVFGFAILGSAFLLAWAAEALQLDVSQGLALTVLALIAVLPEYAVDFTFAYKAGEDPDKFAPLALGEHDRRQPAPHRHRVVDGRAPRRVADDEHRAQARVPGRARHRHRARTTARDRDHVPRDRDAVLVHVAVEAHAHDRRLRHPHQHLRVLRLPALARAVGGATPRRPGAVDRRAPDRKAPRSSSACCSRTRPG